MTSPDSRQTRGDFAASAPPESNIDRRDQPVLGYVVFAAFVATVWVANWLVTSR